MSPALPHIGPLTDHLLPARSTTFYRAVKAVVLVFSLVIAVNPAFATIKPKPKKNTAAQHAKPAAKAKKTTPRRAPAAKSKHRASAPDISPERGTYAAESVQATLAETPANPFLYSRNLDSFFQTVSSLESKTAHPFVQDSIPAVPTVRILQFGDSHTAADYYTGAVRDLLQSRFGNGGLGYQYPGHPFAGYRLAGSSRSQTSGWITDGNHFTHLGDGYVGLGGLSLSTSRPNESITLSTTCTTLQVQYLRQPSGGHLHFTDNGVFISDIDTTAEPGDTTLSAGTMTYACTPGIHDFALTTLDPAPVRLLGLVTEQPGITYECLGINGAYAPLMLQWNQKLFEDYLRQRDPNLIVLAYGTNEAAQSAAHNADYVYDFNRLLQNLHRIVPNASILVLGPYDRAMKSGRGRRASWHTFEGTDRIIADQKESCRLYRCAFYDQRARQGGPGSALRWVSAGYGQPDRTHLTGTGYRALAQAFYLDLLAAYKRYQTEPEPTNQSATHSPRVIHSAERNQ